MLALVPPAVVVPVLELLLPPAPMVDDPPAALEPFETVPPVSTEVALRPPVAIVSRAVVRKSPLAGELPPLAALLPELPRFGEEEPPLVACVFATWWPPLVATLLLAAPPRAVVRPDAPDRPSPRVPTAMPPPASIESLCSDVSEPEQPRASTAAMDACATYNCQSGLQLGLLDRIIAGCAVARAGKIRLLDTPTAGFKYAQRVAGTSR